VSAEVPILIGMDEMECQMTLEREVTEAGRTYQVTASVLADGRTAISLRSGSVDAQELNELSGVIAPEDLPMIARVLRPELASIAVWQGIRLDPPDWIDRREQMLRDFPNAYSPWTDEQERQLIELHESGVSLREIARRLGRRTGGITARLEKLTAQGSPAGA
jgi:DNA-directed RNA polymerase specialized sigma24 family protein